MMDPRDTPAADPLPRNLEAEQALLGALLFDNAIAERLPDHLRGSHFFEPFHQRLFDAIGETINRGMVAEPTILGETFRGDPAFVEFGGIGYLIDLMDKAPPGANAIGYAKVIHDLAVRRDLIRVGGDIIASAGDPDRQGMDLVQNAEAALYGIAETGEVQKGVETFASALDGAMEQIEAAFRRDRALSGLATRLDDLDHKLGGLHDSDLLIVAGRPSMGKTALATNIAFNVARNYRWAPDESAPDGRRTVDGGRVLFFSLEMSKEQLAQRILADVSGISSHRLRAGEIDARDFQRVHDARAEIAEAPLHIDATGGLHIAKLAARARRHKRRHGLELIVVDYLQLITTDGGRGSNRVQEVTTITSGLKALAKELNVPILALSQLSRQVENREDKRPMLSDLRESGSIEQDADAVMFVYRESYYLARTEPKPGTSEHLAWTDALSACQGVGEVIIGKQRHGPIGTVKLSFDENTTRFGNLARDNSFADSRLPYGDA